MIKSARTGNKRKNANCRKTTAVVGGAHRLSDTLELHHNLQSRGLTLIAWDDSSVKNG